MGAPVVVLAGGTGGAKLARGLLDVAGEDLVAIVNTGDDVEMYGAYVSPDPDLVTFWLADRIDERGWGLRDDTFHAMDQLRELGVDVWFNLGDRDLAIGLRRAERLREGATLTRGARRARRARSASARGCCRWPTSRCARASSPAGAWVDFQEFMIRERGAGPVDGVEYAGVEAATPPARGARGDRRRARDRRRPVEPGHLDPADPRRARDGRGAARRAGAGRRRLADRRRRDRQGPDRAVHGVARAAADAAGRRRRLRRPARRHRRRRGRSTASPTSSPTRSWPTPRARRRVARGDAALRGVAARERPSRSCRSSASTTPSSASATTLRSGTRRALAEAMLTDVLDRAAALPARRRGRRRHARARAPTRSPAPTTRSAIRDPDEPGHNPAARAGVRWAIEQGARRVLARPGRLPGARPDRGRRPAPRPPARRGPRHDRPRPPRHGHERAACSARRTRSTPSFGPGSRARHEGLARERRAPSAGSPSRRRSSLDIDTRRGPRGAARRARRAHRRRRPHARRCSRGWGGGEPPRGLAAPGPARGPAGRRPRRADRRRRRRRAAARATCSSSRTRSSRRPRARSSTLAGVAPPTARASSPPRTGKDPRHVQVVLDESAELVRAERGVLIARTRHGFVCANAGVDASNAPARGHARPACRATRTRAPARCAPRSPAARRS